jgi:magnesium-protoporphyrin O-methyltransferase
MTTLTYVERRGQLETYFDRTAVDAWARMTSNEPLGHIRATVRAGRDQMRRTLMSWLPSDLRGRRLLDAGCGTGALSVEAARRGAEVIAIDLSPTLIGLARERTPQSLGAGRIDFRVGDLLDPALGEFDHVVAMDSLIHYQAVDIVRVLSELATRTHSSILITFAPKTPALTAMHAIGRLLPRGDRAPAIEPVAEDLLRTRVAAESKLHDWRATRTERVATGFYISQGLELERE